MRRLALATLLVGCAHALQCARAPKLRLSARRAAVDADPSCSAEILRLHTDDAARKAADPEEILRARYCAYKARVPEFIMDTTHPSNEEYDADRGAWAQRILDFAGAATFVDLTIFDEVEIDDDTQSITWNARIKVLDGLVDDRLVETKDFIERSLFLRGADGAWLYLKGDPDFTPKNVRVDGPLDPKPKPPKRATKAAPARVAEKVRR
jgi:uncharacterized protein YchJ